MKSLKTWIAPSLQKTKEIIYPVRVEFALEQGDQTEKTIPCDRCRAVCLKPFPLQIGNYQFLCPLCYRKQISFRNRK